MHDCAEVSVTGVGEGNEVVGYAGCKKGLFWHLWRRLGGQPGGYSATAEEALCGGVTGSMGDKACEAVDGAMTQKKASNTGVSTAQPSRGQ